MWGFSGTSTQSCQILWAIYDPQSLIAIDLGFAFKVKFFLVNFLCSWSPLPPNAEVQGSGSPHLFAIWPEIQNKHLPLKACPHLVLKNLHYPSLNISKYSLYLLDILYGGKIVVSPSCRSPSLWEGRKLAVCLPDLGLLTWWARSWQQLTLIVRYCLSTLLVLSHLRVNLLRVLWGKH